MEAVIIGGGISGLAAAHRLQKEAQREQLAIKITVLEASNRLGGIISTAEYEGSVIEKGPDSFITTKPEGLRLANELGLGDRLIRTNPQFRRAFIAFRKRLYPMPEGFVMIAPSQIIPLMTSGLFSLAGKLRMMLDVVLPSAPNKDEDESVASFVRRRLGKEALERVAQPMLAGVYTADPETLSLRSTMPQFLEYEQKYGSVIVGLQEEQKAKAKAASLRTFAGSDGAVHFDDRTGSNTGARLDAGARYSMFVSFDRGMKVLVDALQQSIGESHIRLNTRATGVEKLNDKAMLRDDGSETGNEKGSEQANANRADGGRAGQKESANRSEKTTGQWRINLANNETIYADVVIFATPAGLTAQMLQNDVAADLNKQLNSIDYASSAVINLVFREEHIANALDGFGFVVPAIEKRSIIACSYISVKFPNRSPEGMATLRVFMGGALQPEQALLCDHEFLSLALRDLRQYLGIKADPVWHDITRWPESMPQYRVGHAKLVAAMHEQVQKMPGLYLAGGAYAGVGIPDCIATGETAALSATQYLKVKMHEIVRS
jgi:oxygen-dependent protoporphyrinogen oxidase